MVIDRDLHDDFIQMQDIAGARQPSPRNVGDQRAELIGPTPDRFMRNVYATFRHHLFDLAQAQVEPGAEPDNMCNDLGRKAVALVADFLCLIDTDYAQR
jgi:hypothetical protein